TRVPTQGTQRDKPMHRASRVLLAVPRGHGDTTNVSNQTAQFISFAKFGEPRQREDVAIVWNFSIPLSLTPITRGGRPSRFLTCRRTFPRRRNCAHASPVSLFRRAVRFQFDGRLLHASSHDARL